MKASEFLKEMKSLDYQDLLSIEGVGEILSKQYLDFVGSPRYFQLIQDFEYLENNSLGLDIILPEKNQGDLPLKDQVFCITGSFEISREEIKNRLIEKGAKVVSTITNKTTVLLVGDNPGSKIDKIKNKNIQFSSNLWDFL